ncbi:MAG: precorrin-3B C(17)-methyltransferase [Desulfobacterota bacterium]|nr:precorrin-3B C(17)-methyltransferase [Thermodesulfobacteriota bacterium]
MKQRRGKLYVVGIGPGGLDDMTQRARHAIAASEVVVGYSGYLDRIRTLCHGKVIIESGMGKELDRCAAALREALMGKKTTLISGGDAGIYGMAGPVLELALKKGVTDRTAIEIIPGVPGFVAGAARCGAPLMHDFAVISLSDLLTPWHVIEQRLNAAAAGDFVICIYNPRSTGRKTQLGRAQTVLLEYRNPITPCAVLRHVAAANEHITITTLGNILKEKIDMHSMVIIGNSQTRADGSWLLTPRGYTM